MSNSLRSPSRPLSRSSSRGSLRSVRASSPSIPKNDTVAVRNQMSTLKHSIRHQQAQLHSLENIILRGSRPLPPGFMAPSHSPHPSSEDVLDISPCPVSYTTSFSTPKMQRRSSFDVLQGLAGRESNLPLPRRESATPILRRDGIREGIPMDFGGSPGHAVNTKRMSSPTRTLSRMSLAPLSSILPIDAHAGNNSDNLNASTSSLQAPSSPNRRISLTPGGTTKVLADLQAGVINARNALENTKSQLRLSQRTVAQLTRQTEDLKEGRERLRLENEGLNNVVARKERLLQEVLERARKAEAEAATLKSQLKTETATSKKSLREMESALAESTALSQKAEREYITLRDSIKSMTESWKHDTDRLREEMRKREDKLKKEAELVGKKYKLLADEMKEAQRQQASVKDLKNEDQKIRKEVEEEFREEIIKLKARVELQSHQSDGAVETAKSLSCELARLRRLMQSGAKSPPPDTENPPP
ncbi:uncharacterized protein BJ212DRAFT_1369012 [Suillus subaureus]|uniref:SWI5-dependent HO expression protein 3 n=1 Tax=Suillus subaureus TaxID=48587 RepID=A0A9P7JBN6_9AGAM|nr:uncharacterized protein BJ212DRAFT_1369012 [Suillus subaureus]KAG1812921.1 hypothetical protein BJ212DRAFT_1369012 [Suillus subaureus]